MSRSSRTYLAAIAASALVIAGAVIPVTASIATVGNPTVATTAAGTTSVPGTQGKAKGSGLWGYVGDLKTRSSGSVFTYGIAISPVDEAVWVTDSAKIIYKGSGTFAEALFSFSCSSAGATYSNTNAADSTSCYAGDSRVIRYGLDAGADWSIGQYNANGQYNTQPGGVNGGIGANYDELSAAGITNGTGTPNGDFGGVRGLAIGQDGTAWITDPDYAAPAPFVTNTKKAMRLFNPDLTEAGSFGVFPVNNPDRGQGGRFYYNIGVVQLHNGNFVVTNQSYDFLGVYRPDGSYVGSIPLDRPVNHAYPGDSGYRNPNGIGLDPVTGEILVGYARGATERGLVERINPDAPGLIVAPPTNASGRSTTGLVQTYSQNLPSGNGFTVAVDPTNRDVYVAMESGALYVYAADGTYKGRFSVFGTSGANGQVSTVRGIAFDSRGFMYVTTDQGTAQTRVQIFARTPDPVTNLTAQYTSAAKTAANLTWNPLALGVTADAQVPLRDYVIEQSTDGGTTWAVVNTPTSTTASATVTGLDPATTYKFRVSAWNEAGNGDWMVADVSAAAPIELTVDVTGEATIGAAHAWEVSKTAQDANDVIINPETGAASIQYTVTTTPGAVTQSNGLINGQISVTNPSTDTDVTFDATAAVDGSGVSCVVTDGTDVLVAAGTTVDLDYSCTGDPGADLDRTVTATVVADDPASEGTLPEVTKTLDITYEVAESNKTVSIIDITTIGGVAQPARTFGPYTWAAGGEPHVETYSVDVTVPAGQCLVVANTAGVEGGGGSADTSTELCNELALTIADPGTASVTRTYEWSIDKTLTNRAEVEGDTTPGQVNAAYDVTVTEGSATNSNHTFTGVVEITNPNSFRDYTVDIANAVNIPGLTCTLANTTGVVVAANAMVSVPYTCAGDPGLATSVNHDVTVSGDDVTSQTVSSTITYDVTDVNRVITVQDDRHTFDPTWQITWNEAGTAHTQSYTSVIDTGVQAGACQTISNTATIVQTEQSATASFEVCADAVTPTPPVKPVTPTLPATGADSGVAVSLGIAGLLLLIAGAVVIGARRRRA